MLDQPSADLILEQVAGALRQGVPDGFQQRVAANAVDLARRERARAADVHDADRQRLIVLLEQDEDLETLNQALCRVITSGGTAVEPDQLVGHLIATTIEKMRVDQPNYPAFRAVMQQDE